MSKPANKNLRGLYVEPSVFAVVVEGSGKSLLHVGIHYSLDEAISAATPQLRDLVAESGKELNHCGLSMWARVPGEEAVHALLDPKEYTSRDMPQKKKPEVSEQLPPEEQIKKLRKSKNDLMKSLISNGDIAAVSKTRGILSRTEKKYIVDKINEKHGSIETKLQ